jgi:hypothetical protein
MDPAMSMDETVPKEAAVSIPQTPFTNSKSRVKNKSEKHGVLLTPGKTAIS